MGTSQDGSDTGEGTDETTGETVEPNVAFVTSTSHLPGEIGGLAGADDICSARAAEAGLDGTYAAWLSSTSVDGGDRLQGAQGWVRTDGRPFVDTQENLFERRQAFPLRLDENGDDVGAVRVATATTHFGAKRIEDGVGTCEDWTSSNAILNHLSGRSDAGAGLWTEGLSHACDQPVHLYCFGIDEAAMLDIVPEEGRQAFLSAGGFDPSTGIATADQLCQSEAEAAGLDGQFAALLGLDGQSPAARFDSDGPTWVRLDGVPIVEAAEQLATAEELLAPIAFEADETPVFNVLVWSGASSPGDGASTQHCLGWSSAVGTALSSVAGRTAPDWFGDGPRDCDDSLLRVYCLEL